MGNLLITDIYTILKKSTEHLTIKLSSENHPIFKAHFPNNPILPGFIIIDIIADILNDTVINIKLSKFISHMLPNDILFCEIKIDENKRKIKIFNDRQKVCEFMYESK